MTAIMSEPVILIYVTAFLALFLFCIGVSQFVRQRGTRRVLIEKIKSGSGSVGIPSERVDFGSDDRPRSLESHIRNRGARFPKA